MYKYVNMSSTHEFRFCFDDGITVFRCLDDGGNATFIHKCLLLCIPSCELFTVNNVLA